MSELTDELRDLKYDLHESKKMIMKIVDYRFGGRSPPEYISKKLSAEVDELDDPYRWVATLMQCGERNRRLRERIAQIKEILKSDGRRTKSGRKVAYDE